MSRYVDVEYFRDLFNDKYLETVKLISSGETHLDNLAEGFTEASQIIGSLPTADVEEVKHGQWVDLGDSEMCSACTGTKLKEFDTAYGKAMWVESKYCPNCGAKMDL